MSHLVVTLYNNNCIIVEKEDINIRFPAVYIDYYDNSVSLHTWYDIMNCFKNPIIGGCGFNDFIPDDF